MHAPIYYHPHVAHSEAYLVGLRVNHVSVGAFRVEKMYFGYYSE